MALPVRPPIPPMLARLARGLPTEGDYLFEPKWDGFRALAFVDGDNVDIRSRHDRPLARYFPELVAALRELPENRVVLDGEIILTTNNGFDFAALMLRLHPAQSRVELLSTQHPATYVAFDLLAIGDEDVRRSPFADRRRRLESLVAAQGRVVLTRATADRATAHGWLEHFHGGGIDGVMAKARDGRYQAGKRAMVKVKAIRTADCVVAGMRAANGEDAVASVLLGLWDDGQLRHVGVCSTFTREQRAELFQTLAPLERPLPGHPWERGFGIGHSPTGRLKGSAGRWDPAEMSLDWLPLEPRLVAEVAYDTLDDGRFRHPARFLRWRPDRDAASCTFDQLSLVPPRPAEVLDR